MLSYTPFQNRTLSFWLLQATGWLPLFVLFLALFGDDELISVNSFLYATSATILGVLGSLFLRFCYRSNFLQNRNVYVWAMLILALIVFSAELIALLHHALWWLSSIANERFLGILNQQSYAAIGVILIPVYASWSLLYLIMTSQDKLQQATITQQKLALELRDYQLDSLLRQLNPHFIFNTINNIRSLVLKDADAARDMLTRFADIMRYQINVDSEIMVSVQDEIEFVEEYLSLCKLQFADRLTFSCEVAAQCKQVKIPRMSIQLLVENAIKHGFNNTIIPGYLTIKVSHDDESALDILVSNPGELKWQKSDSGIGLENLKKRLEMAFSERFQFNLYAQNDNVYSRIRVKRVEA